MGRYNKKDRLTEWESNGEDEKTLLSYILKEIQMVGGEIQNE